jgi:hypothetical protein
MRLRGSHPARQLTASQSKSDRTLESRYLHTRPPGIIDASAIYRLVPVVHRPVRRIGDALFAGV